MAKKILDIALSAARALLVGALASVCLGALVFLVALLVSGAPLVAGDAARRVLMATGALGLFVGAIGIIVFPGDRDDRRPARVWGLDWRVALLFAAGAVEVLACVLDVALFPYV